MVTVLKVSTVQPMLATARKTASEEKLTTFPGERLFSTSNSINSSKDKKTSFLKQGRFNMFEKVKRQSPQKNIKIAMTASPSNQCSDQQNISPK